MSSSEDYRPCRNCGTLTDSGVCSAECAHDLDNRRFEVTIEVTHTYSVRVTAPNLEHAKRYALDLHEETHENIGPGVTRTEPTIVNAELIEEDDE